MDLCEAILLGIVQGLTEFIPVSSSGHLTLLADLFGWDPRTSLAFDVVVHAGTLLAVVVAYRKTLTELLWTRRRALWPLAIGTAPLLLAPSFAEALVTEVKGSPLLLGLGFWFSATMLLLADSPLARWRSSRRAAQPPAAPSPAPAPAPALAEAARAAPTLAESASAPSPALAEAAPPLGAAALPAPAGAAPTAAAPAPQRAALEASPGPDVATPQRLEDIGARRALLVGLLQLAAVVPGVSRSGATISAGMQAGTPPLLAAELSFLLAIPAILGAMAYEAREIGALAGAAPGPLAAGFFSALLTGLLALWLLKRLLRMRRFWVFAPYLLLLGAWCIARAAFA